MKTVIEEKKLLITFIGMVDALAEGALTVDEANMYLFSPRIVEKLKKEGYASKIISLFEQGCEIEDIQSLLPDRLQKILFDLKEEALQYLAEYETVDKTHWIE